MKEMLYKEFQDAFWNWFDNELTKEQRDKFRNYPADMAELYFYNRVWLKRSHSSAE
jgi:hypothetical protein